MKTLIFSCVMILAATILAAATEATTQSLHIQLIRATDDAAPPTQGSKVAGPKLAAEFGKLFKARHYWIVESKAVEVKTGHESVFRLNAQREVKIDLTKPGQRRVTAISNGKPSTRVCNSLTAPMSLIGGERDGTSLWFIVVRRDKPSTE